MSSKAASTASKAMNLTSLHGPRIGTVTSAGLMTRTVKVQHRTRSWHPHLRKHFPHKQTYLVSDPNNSLIEGDVVEFSPIPQHVLHALKKRGAGVPFVLERIVAPFGGKAVQERPPVLTREEREAIWEKRFWGNKLKKEAAANEEAVAAQKGEEKAVEN